MHELYERETQLLHGEIVGYRPTVEEVVASNIYADEDLMDALLEFQVDQLVLDLCLWWFSFLVFFFSLTFVFLTCIIKLNGEWDEDREDSSNDESLPEPHHL